MGGTAWSSSHYHERNLLRAKTGRSAFEYNDAMFKAAPSARHVNEKMDPKGVKFRESRDSDAHPTSRAVAVLFDVTGSMHQVPVMLQKALPKLMGLLISKGYLEHPQILIGGIGDATCDKAPLQVGQFESGIEIEDDLGKLFLEGGGGGHITESYELAMYFMARHTVMDCLEKRGQKGYLFVIGDETPYDQIDKHQVSKIIGDSIQDHISTMEIVEELRVKFDPYFILPNLASWYGDKKILTKWKKLFGQNVLQLEDPNGICEMIASTIGIAEGTVGIDRLADDLVDAGTDRKTAKSVSKELVPLAANRGTSVAIPDSGAGSGIATV